MSTAMVNIVGPAGGAALGTQLTAILQADDIQPGADPSYQVCKLIYLYHPLGAKIVEKPLEIAQSQERVISIAAAPETKVRELFNAEWKRVNADLLIFNTMSLARIYGIATLCLLVDGQQNNTAIEFEKLWDQKISFNTYDPLNTAGSLTLNQNPLAMDFQHTTEVRVSGSTFHRSRTCVVMNERPIYISFTSSAFGFVGRSVYQRSLFPLKSFINTMITDDMIARKVGVIVAKIKQAGSVINNAMKRLFGQKRNVVKEAQTNNVISISPEEAIESLNLQNLDAPHALARKNIIENIASATPMPAKLMTEESFAEGFGEGTEDAKAVARFIDKVRQQMHPLYSYMDKIVFYRAINPESYKAIQKEHPEEYGSVPFETAFYQWWNSFSATWPSLLKEPDSELIKVDEVKLQASLSLLQIVLPLCDPESKTELLKWVIDRFNSLKLLFDGDPLILNYEEILDMFEDDQSKQEEEHAATMVSMSGQGDDAGAEGSEHGEGRGAAGAPGKPKPKPRVDSELAKETLEKFKRTVEDYIKSRGKERALKRAA